MSQNSSDHDDNNDLSNVIQFESVLLSSPPHPPELCKSYSSNTLDTSIMSYTEVEENNRASDNTFQLGTVATKQNDTKISKQPQYDDAAIKAHPLYQQLLRQNKTLQNSLHTLDTDLGNAKQQALTLTKENQTYRTKLQQAVSIIKDYKQKQEESIENIQIMENTIKTFQDDSISLKQQIMILQQQQDETNVATPVKNTLIQIPLDLPFSPTPVSTPQQPQTINNLNLVTNVTSNNVLDLLAVETTQTPSINTPRSNNLLNGQSLSNEQLLEHISKLESTLTELKSRYNSVKEKYKILYTSFQDTQHENGLLKGKQSENELSLSQSQLEYKNLGLYTQELKNTIAQLEQQLNTAKNDNTNKLNANGAELERLIEEKQGKIAKYKQLLETQQATIVQLKQDHDNQITSLKQQIEHNSSQIQSLVPNDDAYTQLEEEYDNFKKYTDDLKLKYDELMSNYNELQNKQSTLTMTLTTVETHNTDLKQRIDDLTEQINIINLSNNTTESVARELQQNIIEMMGIQKKYTLLETLYNSTLTDYDNETNMLKDEHQNEIKHIQQTKEQLIQEMEQKIKYIQSQQQLEIEKCNQLISQKDNHILKLQHDVQTLQQQITIEKAKVIANEEHCHGIIIEKENYINLLSLQHHDKEVEWANDIESTRQKLGFLENKCYELESRLVVLGVNDSTNNENIPMNDINANDNTNPQAFSPLPTSHSMPVTARTISQNNKAQKNPTTPENINENTNNNHMYQAAMYKKQQNLQNQLNKQKIQKLLDKFQSFVGLIKNLQQYIAFLTKQIEIFITTKKRNLIDVDYLKNVLVRYIQFDKLGLKSERDAMVPVIGTLLHFTKDDYKIIFHNSSSSSTNNNNGLWGIGWFGGANDSSVKSFSAAMNYDFDGTGHDPMSALQGKMTLVSKLQQQQNNSEMNLASNICNNSTIFTSTRNKRGQQNNNCSMSEHTKNKIEEEKDEEYCRAIQKFTTPPTPGSDDDDEQVFDLNGNIIKMKSLLPPFIAPDDLKIDLDEFDIDVADVFENAWESGY